MKLKFQWNAEIRMSKNRKTPKSECFKYSSFDVRLPEETSKNQTFLHADFGCSTKLGRFMYKIVYIYIMT